MASHHHGGGRDGGGRGQANPNFAQGGFRGGRGEQYYGDDRGGRGGQVYGGRGGGGGRGFDGRGGQGGGGYQGGRDGGAGRGRGGYQGGRDGGAGRGGGGYQGGREEGGGRGGGYYQGGRDGGGGRGRDGYQGGNYQGRGGRGGHDYGRGGGQRGGGRGGPSHPPVLRQSRPPLRESYALQAAAMKEKFEMMDNYRDAPMFPPRPSFGTSGSQCIVRANHFFVGLIDKGLHHYDVSITPESTLKGVYRQVMSKLLSEHQRTELGGRFPAYDGGKSLFTAGELPFKSKEFDVTLTAGRAERRYKVAIKHATAVSLHQLMMLMAGKSTDIPGQALQVLDIVLRDIVLNECIDMGYVAVGRSFSSPLIEEPTDLGQGVQGWKGFYQSIRPTQNGLSVVIDISSTPFIEALPLVDFVKKVLKKDPRSNFTTINPTDIVEIKKALRGLKIEVTHRGDQRRKYRIAALTRQLARDLTFEAAPGVAKTVQNYFREVYGLNLQYDFLPCIQVGSEQRPNYLPMEVCKIVPGQRYQKKLDDDQSKALTGSTCEQPSLREDHICQIVERTQYNSSNRAKEFGIEVDYSPTSVQARVLPAPSLRYYGTGSESLCCPTVGSWNMIKKKVVDGARVSNWACINLCHDLDNNTVKGFCSELVRMCQNTGVDMNHLRLPIFSTTPHQLEVVLPRFEQDARARLGGQKIDLLLAILPDRYAYGNFKRVCDTVIGLMSQCCLKPNVRKRSPPTLANIALKINAKVGGRNTVLDDPRISLPVVSNKTTIIFGADVTHPAALDDNAPSIASVVATLDWPEVTKYNGAVRAQGHRVEIINGMEDMVKELLLAFHHKQGKKPEQLIFYRDGVSEGQFKLVFEQEIPAVEKAWKALYNEKPQITFIIVQKRHHTRLFTSDPRFKNQNNGNVPPGTVVDKNICHPTEFDFFLCSHAGIKGTSRPTHYHVLRDDNKFTADGLQTLTYNLCYTYSSCTRSVSFASPAYYAHKLAYRARFYLPQASDAATNVSSSSSSAHAATSRTLPEVKNELKRRMFYC